MADYAHVEFYSVVMETYFENRLFWQLLPELFIQIHAKYVYIFRLMYLASLILYRLGRSRPGNGRELLRKMYLSVAKVAGVMVSVDCRTVSQLLAVEEPSEMELLSPGFVLFMSNVTFDVSLSNAPLDIHEDALRLLGPFQPRIGGYLVDITRLLQLQTGLLARFPKKVLDLLYKSSRLGFHTMQICQRIAYSSRSSPRASSHFSVDLGCAFSFFKTGSAILDAVIDKSSNHLSAEHLPNTVFNLSHMLSIVLCHGVDADLREAKEILQEHRQKHPELSPDFTTEAITQELRLRIWGELVRSRQMQLRVTTATCMCNDLITTWKLYQESLEKSDSETTEKRLNYNRYISSFVVGTGIIDYILGPTCHPEITIESSNIIGFLVVSHTYNTVHTDLWFQTVTSTQDPRISDALVRMMLKILQLFDLDNLCYICEKLASLPIEAFTSSMRDFCDKIIQAFQTKCSAHQETFPAVLYKLLVRLLQESSTYTHQGPAAFQDIQVYAAAKFKEVLHTSANQPARREIFEICVQDVANKSRTSTGSLIALSFLTLPVAQLADLVAEHDFARLLIDDLASTVASANADGISPIYAQSVNSARRRFITRIISDHSSAIDSELGQRLWDLMVGTGVTGLEDRRAGWDDLIALQRMRPRSPFLETCLQEFMPRLPQSCYCTGSLEFVREAIVPLANATNGVILDDEDSLRSSGIELLWQMILTAPARTIEDRAIATLVNEIYVDSKAILSFSLHRARRVHFSLAKRCLQQLKSSAEKLKAFSDGTTSGDDEPMVIVATDEQQREQETQFARSLKVLNTLLRAVQNRPYFSVPDLRSLMLQSSNSIEGEPCGVKYQSFDGNDQSEVKPLNIGLGNTIAYLLTSIREATGFENFRVYYRGQLLTPLETDVCKTVQDFNIRDGLILVKKESGGATSPVRIKPGASPLDIEILSHFKDLWEYLSMEETLAGEVS